MSLLFLLVLLFLLYYSGVSYPLFLFLVGVAVLGCPIIIFINGRTCFAQSLLHSSCQK